MLPLITMCPRKSAEAIRKSSSRGDADTSNASPLNVLSSAATALQKARTSRAQIQMSLWPMKPADCTCMVTYASPAASGVPSSIAMASSTKLAPSENRRVDMASSSPNSAVEPIWLCTELQQCRPRRGRENNHGASLWPNSRHQCIEAPHTIAGLGANVSQSRIAQSPLARPRRGSSHHPRERRQTMRGKKWETGVPHFAQQQRI